MKQILSKIFCRIALLSLLFACEDNDDNQARIPFDLDKKEIVAPGTKSTESIKVNASGSWTATTEAAWLTLSPASGEGTTQCDLNIDASVLNESREGIVYVSSDEGERKTLKVTQFGFDKEIVLSTADTLIDYTATYGKRYIEVGITTNVEFTHQIVDETANKADWIECSNADEVDLSETGARPQNFKLKFEWKSNLLPQERVAKVQFISEELTDTVNLLIRQKPGPVITDDRAGDSLALCIIQEKLNRWGGQWNTNEALNYWDGVTLWTKIDKETKEKPEMIGRVRALIINYFQCKEAIPVEFRHLKYLESLYLGTNSSSFLLDIDLSKSEDGIGELENLKELSIFSYGLSGQLPDTWKNLKKLETLFLESANFTDIPSIITKENFPALKHLSFTASKRYSGMSLYPLSHPEEKLGLYEQCSSSRIKRLFQWENLEYLSFSNCVLEGQIPTARQLYINDTYTAEDLAEKGDTLNYVLGKPKVMPNLKVLRLNLNFLNGDIPDWILYHPNFAYWDPWVLIFNQEANKQNSKGEEVGFNNVPKDFDYYWEAFPLLKPTKADD